MVRGSSQITEGIFGEKDVIWVPQRRASAYLYLIFSPVARNLYCHKGISMSIEENNSSSFNWTSEKVETCDNMELCQESVLIIKSGKKEKRTFGLGGKKGGLFPCQGCLPFPRPTLGALSTFFPSCLITGAKAAVFVTKSCISEGIPSITFAQHSPPPGIVAVSYSNYCEDSLCNNKSDLPELWDSDSTSGTLGGERLVLRENINLFFETVGLLSLFSYLA